MNIKSVKIFLASSSELKDDRVEFELALQRKNDQLVKQGVYLDLIIWEDFVDTVGANGLQQEYNKIIGDSDIFVLLFFTKVGKYSFEEFSVAHNHFLSNGKPNIYTYFKNAPIESNKLIEQDTASLFEFKNKLKEIGHFTTNYSSIGDLKYHFSEQLIKLNVLNSKIQETHKTLEEKMFEKPEHERHVKAKNSVFDLKLVVGILLILICGYAAVSYISKDSNSEKTNDQELPTIVIPEPEDLIEIVDSTIIDTDTNTNNGKIPRRTTFQKVSEDKESHVEKADVTVSKELGTMIRGQITPFDDNDTQALVSIEGGFGRTISDTEGNYVLNVSSRLRIGEDYILLVERNGYESITSTIRLTNNMVVNFKKKDNYFKMGKY